ncbi:putative membrane protein MmpL [Mycobacteroides abscessus subsp. abscessus]|nr:putative membrane protein MmpL [Mycobacteroides abscessus subsp. abscessus]
MKPGMSAETDSARSRPFIARTIRTLSPLIILGWLVLILYTTLASVNWDWTKAIPALETVGDERSVSLMPQDAPAVKAILRMGKDFNESNSDSSAMIVLEGKEPLGDDAHQYYAQLVRELRNDPEHVEHVQDLWGDRLTSSSVQSPDEKAAYVQLNLVGNQGTAQGDQSVAAVRDIVKRTSPSAPKDVETYVAGAAPLASDMQHAGNKSILKITAVTVVIIFTLLLILYRSVITVILLLIMVGVELAAARGIVAFLGHHDVFVLSTFAVNMLVFLSIAAGTDYGRPVSGGTSGGPGPRDGLLHHISQRRPGGLGVGRHNRWSHSVPALHPVALLPDNGYSVCHRHARGSGGGRYLGTRRNRGGKPVRSAGTQAQVEGSAVASHRYRGCAVAGAHSGRVAGGGTGRTVHPPGV